MIILALFFAIYILIIKDVWDVASIHAFITFTIPAFRIVIFITTYCNTFDENVASKLILRAPNLKNFHAKSTCTNPWVNSFKTVHSLVSTCEHCETYFTVRVNSFKHGIHLMQINNYLIF